MVAVVSAWFDRQRALAVGVAVTGIGVGTLAGAPLAVASIAEYGWRQAHVLLGAGGALLLAAAHAAMGSSFVILRLTEPDDAQVVYLEDLWSADYVDRPATSFSQG
jgi:MFS family permease